MEGHRWIISNSPGNRLTALFVTIGTCRGRPSEVKELAQSLGLQEAVLMKDLGIHRTSKKPFDYSA
jgi:hypothetical protein